jgi:hypothetical protein
VAAAAAHYQEHQVLVALRQLRLKKAALATAGLPLLLVQLILAVVVGLTQLAQEHREREVKVLLY